MARCIPRKCRSWLSFPLAGRWRLLPLVAIFLLPVLAGASAETWKGGRIRDLTFEVPATWEFLYEAKAGMGAYAPDARDMKGLGTGVIVMAEKAGTSVPKSAITKTEQVTIAGKTATALHVTMPGGKQTGRIIDFDAPASDGRPVSLVLVADSPETAAILDHVLASLRFDVATVPFIVPELSGSWYLDGLKSRSAEAHSRDGGAYFSVDPDVTKAGDDRIDVVRLGPTDVKIVAGAPVQTGTIDVAGTRIDWANGSHWSRTPDATATETVVAAPALAGTLSLGPIATGVPENWVLIRSEHGPLTAAYARDPALTGLAGLALVTVTEDEAAHAFDNYLAQANLVLLQGGRPLTGVTAKPPFAMAAHYEGLMVWGTDGAQPTILEARGAFTTEGLAIVFVAWPAYAPAAIADTARAILDGSTLSGVGMSGGNVVQPASVALDSWRSPAEAVLFAGADSDRFVHHAAGGGDFARDARFADGALVVDVKKDSGWGKVGLMSPLPLVWLDDLTKGAEVTVTFTIDPARTTGFVVALAQPGWGGVAGNDPGSPNALFFWAQKADGTSRAAFHLNPHRQDDYWSREDGTPAPATVSFTIRAGEITLNADGYAPVTKPWATAADGTGLFVWAYSHPAEAKMPVTFALTGIAVDHTYPTAPSAEVAATVAPLPAATLFDGAMNPNWKEAEIDTGAFARFARFDNGTFVVDVPEKNGWAKVGLLSAEPFLTLDKRVHLTPTRLALTLDPTHGQNLVVALSDHQRPDMWTNHIAWFTFSYLPDRDHWLMALHRSPYQDWSREIDAKWITAHWDGRLWLDFGDGWASMELPGGPVLRGAVPTTDHSSLYVSVITNAPANYKPATMALKRIEYGLVTPARLGPADRWALIDDADFDPDAFLDEIAGTSQETE